MTRAAAVVAVMLLFAGCGFGVGFEKPRVSFTRVELTSVGFDGVAARFLFTVENPNWVGLSLARLSYRVSLDGKKVIEGGLDQGLQVPARGAGELGVPMKISFTGLANTIEALLTRDSVAWALHTELGFGTPVGVINVPVDTGGTFPVPKLPEISLASVEVSEMGLTGAGLDVTVGLRNPNEWPLPVGGLRFQLSVNGARIADSALQPMTLPAGETALNRLHFSVDLLQVGAAVVGAIASRSATIVLDGTLGVGPYNVPIRASQTLR